MPSTPHVRHTAIATLQCLRPDLVEIRYKAGSLLTPDDMAEVLEARRQLMHGTPYGMITLLPADLDVQMTAMRVDHLEADRRDALVVATTVVAEAHMIELLVKLYFSYFPQQHHVRVTADEAEARA